MKNGKAVGPDGLPIEALKAGGAVTASFLASIYNDSYLHNKSIGIGDGTLRALPKPGKTPDSPENLRPIILLTSHRKILSLITLRRIQPKVDQYLSASQAGFRRGRSTADIVWAHRWLAATAIRYQKTIRILGLDMSRAFDTIDRNRLMKILEDEVKLDKDELRICQSLLADTCLKVKLGKALSDPFQSTIGTPQGDGLSPILFAVYLEYALREVRKAAGPRPEEDEGIPLEAIYADDTDFISMCQNHLNKLEKQVPDILAKFNLFANPSKWERTAITPPVKLPTKGKGENREEEATWRKTKKLGTLLGDQEDIERRKSLATAAFRSLRLLWQRKKVTSIKTRMRAYNALVLPVLLHNCGTWGTTEAMTKAIEIFHRRQLREVLGVKTREISSKMLYDQCDTYPLHNNIVVTRWSLFGHILRLDRKTPAQLAMDYYVKHQNQSKGREGRPTTTLPVLLLSEYRKYKEDKKMKGWTVGLTKNDKMLEELRLLASDRGKWRSIVSEVVQLMTVDNVVE